MATTTWSVPGQQMWSMGAFVQISMHTKLISSTQVLQSTSSVGWPVCPFVSALWHEWIISILNISSVNISTGTTTQDKYCTVMP